MRNSFGVSVCRILQANIVSGILMTWQFEHNLIQNCTLVFFFPVIQVFLGQSSKWGRELQKYSVPNAIMMIILLSKVEMHPFFVEDGQALLQAAFFPAPTSIAQQSLCARRLKVAKDNRRHMTCIQLRLDDQSMLITAVHNKVV